MARDPHVDRIVARIAAAQHGVVTRVQLRRAGLSDEVIDRRIRSGLLVPVHRGVYALGGVPLSGRGRFIAALHAAGPTAALSHDSAAGHWGLWAPRRGPVHVTVGVRRRSRGGLVVHESKLPDRSVTQRDGLRCTTVARTVFDLAALHGAAAASRAWTTAASRRLLRPQDIEFEVARAVGRPGAHHVADLAAAHGDYLEQHDRSLLERRALAMLRDAEVPRPAVNRLIVIGDVTLEADLVWGTERIVVEVDGRGGHEHGVAFEDDRDRDALLGLSGWRSMRWTRRDIDDRPEQTVARIRAMLRQDPLRPAPAAPKASVTRRAGAR